MLIQRKQELIKAMDTNYVMIRDDDWELLTLVSKDAEWYYAYYFEHCDLTRQEAEALLDKAAWVALTPIVDEKVLNQYKDELKEVEKKMEHKLWDD